MNKVSSAWNTKRKKEETRIRKLYLFLTLLLVLAGCTENGIRIQNDTDEESSKVKKMLSEDERIMSGSALFYDDDLLVGIRVSTFNRFKKSKIDKEIQKKLEEVYPDLDVTVSADSKILYEATKLLNEDQTKDLSKKIDELKSLIKEET